MIPTENPWAETVHGHAVDLFEPDPNSIFLDDIVWSLGRQLRFNGHTTHPISISMHSLEVASCMPRKWAIYGLLHDAHEAFVGDQISPVKRAFTGDKYRDAVIKLDRAIYKSFEVPYPTSDILEVVADVDLAALYRERELFMSYPKWDWQLPPVKTLWGSMLKKTAQYEVVYTESSLVDILFYEKFKEYKEACDQ